jgi:2-methylisocitrate lyase-like PEP mutase family enzyme
MADPSLKSAIEAGELVVAPGIIDGISTRIADRMGFKALYATGYGTVASYLGVADAGIATYTDMVARVSRFAQIAKTPIIADADTGYGGLLNVRHTVMGYEAGGITAIQMEDQESPKKCGHTPGRSVIRAEEMALKIEVAAEARKDPNFLIIARTDARTTLGLDEAIRRGKLYRKAGADVIFVESPESEDEMKRIGDEIDAPLFANMVNGGGRTPILPAEKLKAYGCRIAIYPALGFLAMSAALTRVYGQLLKDGDSLGIDKRDEFPFADMNELMGFPEVWAFDKKWARDFDK